jgi:hypothetical protein
MSGPPQGVYQVPISVSWITPGRIIRLTLSGNVTLEELAGMRDEVSVALTETSVRLDYILDLRDLEQVTDKVLHFILSKHGSLRNVKTGCLAVIGGTDQQRLILASATLALHVAIGYFEDDYGALEFISESMA